MTKIPYSTIFDRAKYQRMYFIGKFDRGNIDGHHLRPPVFTGETIERENLMDCSIFSSTKKVVLCSILYSGVTVRILCS